MHCVWNYSCLEWKKSTIDLFLFKESKEATGASPPPKKEDAKKEEGKKEEVKKEEVKKVETQQEVPTGIQKVFVIKA